MCFTQFLMSELNWEPKRPKPISRFYSTSFPYRRIMGELSSVEINQIYNTQGKKTVEKVLITCNKKSAK